MQTIKITSTGKGEYHWEDYLLGRLQKRLNKLLTQLNIDPWKKKSLLKLSKRTITRENIVKVYSHPIREILKALINREIKVLENNSSIEYLKH